MQRDLSPSEYHSPAKSVALIMPHPVDKPCGHRLDKPDVYANVGQFKNWVISVIKMSG